MVSVRFFLILASMVFNLQTACCDLCCRRSTTNVVQLKGVIVPDSKYAVRSGALVNNYTDSGYADNEERRRLFYIKKLEREVGRINTNMLRIATRGANVPRHMVSIRDEFVLDLARLRAGQPLN